MLGGRQRDFSCHRPDPLSWSFYLGCPKRLPIDWEKIVTPFDWPLVPKLLDANLDTWCETDDYERWAETQEVSR